MDSKPLLYIQTLHNQDGKEIAEGILGTDVVSNCTVDSNIVYEWEIENKYYDAKIKIHVGNDDAISPQLRDMVEALIVVFDPSQKNVLSDLSLICEKWELSNPDVKMLACDTFNRSTSVTREEVLKWCIENEWELVVLQADDSSDDDEVEDDFKDSFGLQRIKQALHANMWSNLNMKDGTTSMASSLMQSLQLSSSDEEETPYEALESVSSEQNGNIDPTEQTDLDTLFSSFSEMKEKASTLPLDERRKYAEKVTLAFWRALGGDEDEIEGV